MPEAPILFPIRSDKLSMNVAVTAQVAHIQTEFQTIDIVDTEVFGRLLLLDGHIQLTEMDEHAYHESLVQIPLMSIENPKTALVVGGGDGGVLRELVKHESIEHIDMVEIDSGVVEAAKAHLPFLSDGAFADPRVHLLIADAFPFVKQPPRQYDLIIVDSTDTYEDEEGALSEMLFTAEFYQDCLAVLTDRGVVVTQADNHVFCPYSMESIQTLFSSVFPKVGNYQAIIPSFGGFSGFVWGSRSTDVHAGFRAGLHLRYLNQVTYDMAFQPFRF